MNLTNAQLLIAGPIPPSWLTAWLLRHTDAILLGSGLIGHIWLTAMLLRRRIQRSFVIFVAYQAYAVLAVAARLSVVELGESVYFRVFWWTELGFLALGIAASHEAFRWVFSGFYRLKWFRWFYYGGIGLTIAISAINSAIHAPVNTQDVAFGRILQFSIVINGIQAAIFALFYLLVKLLEIGFRRYAFGISLGLGIASVGTLLPYVVRSEFGTVLENIVLYAPTVAYFVSLIVWLSAFTRAEPESEAWAPPMPPELMAEEVKQYIAAMKSFFGKHDES
ncbi:MAG: hypothetical protein LAP21_22645 [Acidobacteriia bacterium]|nr:hypothetical protein [Terriglobia bacterium]